MKLNIGEPVVAVMHSPREKLFGILDEIGPAGICIRAIELGYFDDWCRDIASGDAHLGMTDQFIPMWRIERVSRDESTADMPSMADQFTKRTGREIGEF